MAAGPTYEPIATTTLASATGSITFSSISSAYTDLRLVIVTGCATGATASGFQFNGDTTTNYSTTYLSGDGTSAASSITTSQTYINAFGVPDSSTGNRGMTTVDIFSYAGSTNKTVLLTNSRDANGSGYVARVVGLWRSTSAITSVTFTLFGVNTLIAGTTATLYGIKAA